MHVAYDKLATELLIVIKLSKKNDKLVNLIIYSFKPLNFYTGLNCFESISACIKMFLFTKNVLEKHEMDKNLNREALFIPTSKKKIYTIYFQSIFIPRIHILKFNCIIRFKQESDV